MMDRFTDSGWMPMMGIGLLGMIVFWGLLIAGTVFLIRWFLGETVIKREDSALEILKKRYARGEINKQEFDERKRDLMG
jgi:putative membrane protein